MHLTAPDWDCQITVHVAQLFRTVDGEFVRQCNKFTGSNLKAGLAMRIDRYQAPFLPALLILRPAACDASIQLLNALQHHCVRLGTHTIFLLLHPAESPSATYRQNIYPLLATVLLLHDRASVV